MPPHTLTFRFTHYRSTRLRAMLQVAEQGHLTAPFMPMKDGGWYQVTFALSSRAQVHAALSLAELLLRHPCAEAYGNGQRVNPQRVVSILRCYEKSFGPSQWKAHCYTVQKGFFEAQLIPITYTVRTTIELGCGPEGCSNEPGKSQVEYSGPGYRPWYFPCRYAEPAVARIAVTHPAGIRAQVEQALTAYECTWCPRLQHLDTWELEMWGRPPEPVE